MAAHEQPPTTPLPCGLDLNAPVARPDVDANEFRVMREIDHQVAMLDAIDTKAEHVTRLVVLFIGVILTAISIGIRRSDTAPQVTRPTEIAFVLGMVALAVAMAAAIVTYLSSRIRLGLHPSTADTFERVDVSMNQYATLVINTDASVIEDNKAVLDVNSFRFRVTLIAFLAGVTFIATAILRYLLVEVSRWGYVGVGLAGAFVGGFARYIGTGRYLPIQG